MTKKNISNTEQIPFDDYKRIQQMLKSSDDDFELALVNIKNLKLNEMYLILFAKGLSFNKRYSFQEYFQKKFNNLVDSSHTRELDKFLTWDNIITVVKKDYSDHKYLKDIIELEVGEYINTSLKLIYSMNFITLLTTKIKW